MNRNRAIYFPIKGITVVKKGEAEKIKIGSFPPLKDVIDQAVKAGVKLFVCEQNSQLLGLSRGDFILEAKVVGAATCARNVSITFFIWGSKSEGNTPWDASFTVFDGTAFPSGMIKEETYNTRMDASFKLNMLLKR